MSGWGGGHNIHILYKFNHLRSRESPFVLVCVGFVHEFIKKKKKKKKNLFCHFSRWKRNLTKAWWS